MKKNPDIKRNIWNLDIKKQNILLKHIQEHIDHVQNTKTNLENTKEWRIENILELIALTGTTDEWTHPLPIDKNYSDIIIGKPETGYIWQHYLFIDTEYTSIISQITFPTKEEAINDYFETFPAITKKN